MISEFPSGELPNSSGIYQIFCTENRKRYVGSSCNISKRCSQHLSDLRGSHHGNRYLQNAFNKYGEGAFVFTALEICNTQDLLNTEQFYIDNLPCEFNIAKDALAPMWGRTHTQEARGRMSSSRSGERNHFYGKRHSEQTRAKMKKRKVSDENRKLLSELRIGTQLTEETKRKISVRGKNRFKDQNERQRYSEIFSGENNPFYGKSHTEEIKDRYRKAYGRAIQQIDKETKQVITIFESIRQAAELTGIDRKSISWVAKGKKNHNTAGGYIWRFEND